MYLHSVSVKENVQTYISPILCLTPEIKSKYSRTGECVGIGQTTVFTSMVVTSSNIQDITSSPFLIKLSDKYDG